MLLSSPQQTLFWRLWSAACKAQGWTTAQGLNAAQINEHRKRILAECGFSSLTLVDKIHGFNKVKNTLETLGDKLTGPIEAATPSINVGRQMRWKIENEIIPALGKHVEHPEAYARKIALDKFPHLKREGGAAAPWDLASPLGGTREWRGMFFPVKSELQQLLITLTARLNTFDKKATKTVGRDSVEPKPKRTKRFLATAGDPY